MPYDPNPGAHRSGFVTIVHDESEGRGEVPIETLAHWQELGWRLERSEYHHGDAPDLEDVIADPSPAPAVENPAPEGDTPTSEEDK